jgi:hypothetical protein
VGLTVDPISLAVGGCLILVGYLLGRIGRRPRPVRAADPTICAGCEHGLTFRNPETGACQQQVKQASEFDEDGFAVDYRWVQCECRNHVNADQLAVDSLPFLPTPARPEDPR